MTEADLRGEYAIVYFGYTYCPDVCPVDLQNIAAGLRQFESANPEAAENVVPVFVSVDPERDTPAAVAQYVAAFHPRLIGLTGTPEQVEKAADAYKIFYQKYESEGASDYLVNHSRQAYLFGPEGDPIALLPADQSGEAVAEELERWVG